MDHALLLAEKLSKECALLRQRHEPAQARPLREFEINEEGYCILCEGYSQYSPLVKRCVVFFMKVPRLQMKEVGHDAIIYEKELVVKEDERVRLREEIYD